METQQEVVTKEKLEKEVSELKLQREKMVGQLNNISGQIIAIEKIIKMLQNDKRPI